MTAVVSFLASQPAAADNPVELWVRVNSGVDLQAADVEAVVGPALTGLVLAKTENAGDVERVVAQVETLEKERGLENGAIAMGPLLESASAVLQSVQIALAPRVRRLQVGEADLRADVGITPGDDERELLWVRSSVVLASTAAKISPPVGPVTPNFLDVAALKRSTLGLKRLGYVGRACIHPSQVAVVNEVFTPTALEVDKAQALIARFDAAGGGVLVDDDGRMVDEAVVRQARRLLTLAR